MDKITSENQSAVIKNRTVLQRLSIIRDIVDLSNKLNKNRSVIPLEFLKAFESRL